MLTQVHLCVVYASILWCWSEIQPYKSNK